LERDTGDTVKENTDARSFHPATFMLQNTHINIVTPTSKNKTE